MKKFLQMIAFMALLAVPWATNAQVCMPNPTSKDGSGVTNVTYGTGSEAVNQSITWSTAPYYQSFTSQIGAVQAGTTANVAITFATGYSYGTIIWVDWNNDSTFAGTEVVYVGEASSNSPTVLAASFDIPATQDTGTYMMRICAADMAFDSYTTSIAAAASANPCATYTYGIGLDFTLRVTEAPSCLAPATFSCQSVSGDTANLVWTDASGLAWDVVWGPQGMNPDTVIVNTASTYNTNYSITGLAGGLYSAYVRTDCGSEYSTWKGPVNFGVGIYYMAVTGIDTLRTCGSVVYDDGGPNGNYSSSSQSTLVLVPNQANRVVKISGSSYTESTWDYLTIYGGGEMLWTDNGVDQLQSFGPFMSDTITIVFYSDASVTRSGFEINVSCEPVPTCARPDSLIVESVDTTEVTLRWVDNVGTNWTVEYGLSGFTPGDVSDTSIHFVDFTGSYTGTVTGLAPGVKYDFYLMSVCGTNEGDTSWTRMVSTYTSCGAINSLPYTEDWESFETGENAEFHPCWTKGSSPSGYPYVFSSAYFDFTSNALYFYGYDDFTAWAVMPAVGDDFEMDELELSLDAYIIYSYSSYGHNFLVGVIDTNVYVHGTTHIDTIADFALTVSEHKDISFAGYEGNGRNIIILGYLDGDHNSMYLALDNIDLHVLPSCTRPDSLALLNADSSELELGWWAEDNATDFYVEWRNADSNTIAWSYDEASTNSYTITNLLPNTVYNVRVRTVCGGDTSLAVNGQFRTSCVAVTSFPWFEGFENGGDVCWRSVDYNSYSSDDWELYSYVGHTGTNCMISSYAFDAPGANWLISPAIELGDTMSAAQLSYWVFGEPYNTYPRYAVKVSTTSGTDTTAFTTLFEETRDDIYDDVTYEPVFGKVSISLGQYAGQTIYIAFVRHAGDDDGLAIDDITIQNVLLPEVSINGTEAPVVGLVASYAAQVDGGDTVGMTYAWSSARAAAGTATMTVVDPSHITMLYPTAGVDTLRLIATNVFGIDTAYLVVSPMSITFETLPYSTGFEPTNDTLWTISNAANGWYIDTAAAYTGNYGLYVSNDNGAHNVYNASSQSNSYAYKAFNFAAAGQYGVSFDWRAMGEIGYDYLRVYLVPINDSSLVGNSSYLSIPSTWKLISGTLNGSAEWQSASAIVDVTAPGVYYVVMFWHNDNMIGTNPPAAVDNFSISYITCSAPVSLVIDNVTATSASFHWSPTGGETSWEVRLNNNASVTVTDTFYTATGLTPATNYNVRVRAICGAGDTSLNLSGSFWTECVAYNVPYYIQFNTDPLNVCWSDVVTSNSSTSPSVSWNSSVTAGYQYIYSTAPYVSNPTSDYLISPVYNIPDTDTVSLRLVMQIYGTINTYYASSRAAYQILVSPTGADSVAAFTDTLYVADSVNSNTFDFLRLPVNAYAGQSVRFAVRNVSRYNGTVYLYDFALRYTHDPLYYIDGNSTVFAGDTNNYAAVHLEGDLNGMTFSWTSTMAAAGQATMLGANTDSMQIIYNAAGIDTLMFVASNSFGHDTSITLVSVYNCGVITNFPYSEGFESSDINPCWTLVYGDNDPGTNPMLNTTTFSGVSGAHGGQQAFRFSSYSNSSDYNQYLISPEIGGSNLALSFWYAKSSSYGDDHFRVGYSSTNRDIASFTWDAWFDSDSISNSQWTQFTENIPAGTKFVAIQYYGTYAYYIYIDDLTIDGAVAVCNAPVLGTPVATETSVAITWSGEANTYEVAYVEGDSWVEPTAATTVNNDSTYTFTGLTGLTDYVIGVRAVCDNGGISTWSTVSVTTLRHPCAVPGTPQVTGNTYDGATVTWTAGEDETEWELRVFCNSPVYEHTYTVSGTPSQVVDGLDAATTYSVTVRALCDSAWYSVWSDTVDLTTLTCPMVTGVTASNVTATGATISWTSTNAVKYEIEYGDMGFQTGTGTMLNTTNTTITLNNLEEQSAYDVFVRGYCTDDIAGDWSERYRFTTPAGNGIADVENSNVTLYPNPASSMVTIGGLEGESTVTVVDLNGREVYQATATGSVTIDVSGYAKGAYFVRVTGESTTAIRKLIVK